MTLYTYRGRCPTIQEVLRLSILPAHLHRLKKDIAGAELMLEIDAYVSSSSQIEDSEYLQLSSVVGTGSNCLSPVSVNSDH
jgi:hypothetical protein